MEKTNFRCILVMPYWKDSTFKGVTSILKNNEALGIQYLSAVLKNHNIEHTLINAHEQKIENDLVVDNITMNQFNLVGISCSSQKTYLPSKELIVKLRNAGYKGIIAMGGPFATIAFRDIMQDIPLLDYIFLGEAEYSFPLFLKKLSRNEDINEIKGLVYRKGDQEIAITSSPERITNLDILPFPVRSNVISTFDRYGEEPQKMMRILGGRGCYGACKFCCVIQVYPTRKKIYRSPSNVIDEMESLIELYQVDRFRFNDEIFYDSSPQGLEWVNEFIAVLKKRKIKISFDIEMRSNDITEKEMEQLKEVGLKRLSIGIESGIQRILNEMNKNTTVEENNQALKILKKVGITPFISFIAIMPTMTFEELKVNYNYLFSLDSMIENNIYNKFNLNSKMGRRNIGFFI